jgi:predicted dehydrogenase
MDVSRRNFLGAGAAAVVAAGTKATGKVFGANDTINVCVMGVNGRGGSHIEGFGTQEGVNVYAICDVDTKALEKGKARCAKVGLPEPKTFTDIREALQDDNIDVLSIATPNHWHTLATIWGVQAGKDVYVEKPATHSIYEGQELKKVVAASDRIVQHGTQNRSSGRWMRDIQLMRDGIIGDIYMARGLCYKNGNRGSIGFHEPAAPPERLNWDLWQGPAQERQYSAAYHPYTWHWFWEYGNGEIGNQGVHQMDVGTWIMNKGMPTQVYSAGGRYTYEDQAETPNTQITTYTYADGTQFVFEVRNRFTNDEGGVKVGNLAYGSGGYYMEGAGFFDTEDKPIAIEAPEYETAGTFGNFIAAVRSRKKEDIHGNMDDAHIGCAHCHLGAISYQLGRSLEFDPTTERFLNANDANDMLRRDYRAGFEV